MEYPIVIKDSRDAVVDRVANADSAVTVLYGDLKARGREQYIVEIPDGPEWDRAAGWINGEIRLAADCYGLIQLDRVVRVSPPAPERITPHRDNPVTVDWSDTPVCQHGNPVPGYCAGCEYTFGDDDFD